MSDLKNNSWGLFRSYWPILTILFLVCLFFWKVFFLRQAPVPGDFIVGTYYPWLDYKWGYVVGVPVKNPITSDVASVIYPLRSYAVDVLKTGKIPLWNPFMFAGYPLLANYQVAILSPTIIFYFFLPKVWAWTAQVMFQPFLAALFAYVLLKHFGLAKLPSLMGGLFYAFSGFSIIHLEWSAHALVAAFIPLLIFLFDKFLITGKLKWGVFFSFALCLQVFSGYPQLIFYTFLALFLLLFLRKEKVNSSRLFWLILFTWLGILLSAIQTLPAAELILNSQRRNEWLEADLIYLPWQNLITFLAPDYFGNPATGNYWGKGNYSLNAGYSGVIVLTLAIIGISQYWQKREIKYFVWLFFLALLISLPTPLAKLISHSRFPGISAASNTRSLILANLALAMLAAFGLSFLLQKRKLTKLKAVFLPVLLLLAVLVITFVFPNTHLKVSLRNLVLPLFFSASILLAVLGRQKFYQRRYFNFLAVCVISVLALVELFRYGLKYTPFSSPDLVFPETPVLSFLKGKESQPFRISPGDVISMNMWVPYGLESISGYDAAYPVWWARLFWVIESGRIDYENLSRYAHFDKYADVWFDLLNNKYVFAIKTDLITKDHSPEGQISPQFQTSKFEEIFADRTVVILENKESFPRAFFVTDWEYKTQEKEILSSLLDPEFPFAKKIIITEETDLSKSNSSKSQVVYLSYSPEKSLIKVDNDKDGFLFVSDAWYPGWQAKVDGQKAPLYRANYAFRAVPLKEGNHEVEFIYAPLSFKMGQWLTGATGIFLTTVFIYDTKNKNRR